MKKILKFVGALIVGMSVSARLFAQMDNNSKNDTIPNQKDVIDILRSIFSIKDKKQIDSLRSTKKVQFSILPAAAGVPGGGTALVTSTNMAFYTGPRETTSLSSITFTPWTNFEGRFVFPFRSNIWLKNNKWNIVGDMRFMIYPQYSWGLGGNSPEKNKTLVTYDYLRLHNSLLRKIGTHWFLGGGYKFDDHFSIKAQGDSLFVNSNYKDSLLKNTISSGLTLNILFDSRKNSINSQNGWYALWEIRFNTKFLGSTYDWKQLFIDIRKYFSFSKTQQNTLAFWTFYWSVINGRSPYLDLPSIGWDSYARSGRGYLQNRYRSNTLFYAETEYRRDITQDGLLGFVAFVNVHSASEYKTRNFVYWHPAGGVGLRFKFNKFSGTNITLDYGHSNQYNGIYLNIGETF